MNWFTKRKMTKRFVKELPLILKKMYGKRNSYTEDQIKAAFDKVGYNSSYIEFAFAIFMSKSKFEQNSLFLGDSSSYEKLRYEIANRFFRSNTNFSIHDLVSQAVVSKAKMAMIFDYRNVGAGDIEGSNYIINDD